ncbi:oligosaccharide flippase family protein [Kitasatospora phosalacinea]|uniref:oligosaccharide flippase family protein n=1 Tax=Kitasatospora phosalacinea TaxID=2065 RepID=UPI0036613BA1
MRRSSFFLLTSSVLTAGLGFVFWVMVARFYPPEQVGLATSLISATSLLAYLSLFGVNSTLVRFPAVDGSRNAQITQALVLVASIAVVAGVLYLFGLAWYGPKLLFIRRNLLTAGLFVLFCVWAAVNQLTDSVFIAARQSQYNVLVDGLLQGVVKLLLPVGLAGFGVYGILGSAGAGYAVAALASLLLMRLRTGFRPDFYGRGTRLREQLPFALSSYVSSLLNLLPVMVLPLIVLEHLGTAATGFYYMAFQIASLLHAISLAVSEAVFAEVSSDESLFGVLLRRSARTLVVVQVPAVLAVVLGSGLLLRLFGSAYHHSAQGALVTLAVGALAVALNTWSSFALKLAGRMGHLILSNIVFCGLTIGLAAYVAPHGLLWVAGAWGVGNLASGLYAVVVLATARTLRQEGAPDRGTDPAIRTRGLAQ